MLVAGGGDGSGLLLQSAELYDPSTGKWSLTGTMKVASNGLAVLLGAGKVLVAGGSGQNGPLAATQLYDPNTGKWSLTGSLKTPRAGNTLTLLSNSKALITGGIDSSNQFLSSAELYNPVTGKWNFTGSMNVTRLKHTATLLNNGKVLVAGGLGFNKNGPFAIASAEVYDPTSGARSLTGSLNNGRYDDTATLLANGKVLVAGGSNTNNVPIASAELYTPAP